MEPRKKRIALVADDNRMPELLDWAKFNRDLLAEYDVFTTTAAFNLLTQELQLTINKMSDQHKAENHRLVRLLPSENDVDFLVVFVDPTEMPVIDPDIKALLDNATFRNVPIAGNRRAADHMFPSCLALIE
ncbi:MAG: methylglyoxal synthase [Anaerolineaceae bacterium]|nr:methylglyoxal synthase [Anaerolineaceae bacterium]MCB9098994.1 methylglyoxal synthase [Anaerolineales bacterium]